MLGAGGEIVFLRRVDAGALAFVQWIVKLAAVVFAAPPARCPCGVTPAPPPEHAESMTATRTAGTKRGAAIQSSPERVLVGIR